MQNNNISDRELVVKILKLKMVYGVSFCSLAKQIGVTASALYNLRNGNGTTLSTGTKQRLIEVVNRYEQITL